MTKMLIKMLFISSRCCKHHFCSSQREEMKLGHEHDVVNQEYRYAAGCSYCYRYEVAFILAWLRLLLLKHDL